MDDIDELIEQLKDYVKRHSKEIDQNYVGVQLAKKAITALRAHETIINAQHLAVEIQKERITELENDNINKRTN